MLNRHINFIKLTFKKSFSRNFGSSNLKYFISSSNSSLPLLNPWWVTGFCDAESSFSMFISKSNSSIIGWTVSSCFNITLHIRDLEH